MARPVPSASAIEAQLRAVESRLRMIVDHATDGIFIADLSGRYQDVNAAACAMLGYSRDELLTLSFPDMLAPEEISRLAGEIERLMNGSAIRSEWRFRRKDLLGVVRDVSDRKRVEERLRESEARYRLIVENQTEFIVKWRPDGTRTFVNEHYCRLFGVTEEECIGTSFFPLVDPQHHDAIRERIAALTPEHSEFTEEHVSYSATGAQVQLWTSRGIFDESGRLVELLSTGRDITERKYAEQKLLHSQTHLLASQRIAGVGSWEIEPIATEDPDSSSITWSPECHRLLGYGPDDREMSTAAFYRRVHPEDRQKVRDAFHQAIGQGSRYSIDHRIVLDDGSERILHEQAERVLDPVSGATIKMIGTTEDITDRVRLEEQLRQSQKMQAIGQLAGGVAHDFNNLLTVINGYSEMLLMDQQESNTARHELAAIRDAGERAAQLTRQLLLFSRKAVFEPRVVDLNDLVQQAGVMLRRLIAEDVELTLTLAPKLSSIKADPSQLEQQLLNLALNARDAMGQGGRLIIETRAVGFDDTFCSTHHEFKPGRFVRLVVADTGCGMSPETRAHLFEPFFTTKGPGKGTGLGLATVYGIVQESSGFITVSSEIGVGTTMSVFLPALDAPAAHSVRSAIEDSMPSGHETVLLVEDEEAVRGVATLALTMQGYRVLAASSGPAALRIMDSAHHSVDLLVTDVVMPEMSGGELAQFIRTRDPACRVLFMSGYNEDVAVRHGHHGQNDGFLQKPFTPLLLARKVREILDRPVL